jgi:hypothetical protein
LRQSGNTRDGLVADWAGVDPKTIINLISATVSLNGAIRFGYTRDGGAYSVGIYLDDDHETFYFKPSDDIDSDLDSLAEKIRGL